MDLNLCSPCRRIVDKLLLRKILAFNGSVKGDNQRKEIFSSASNTSVLRQSSPYTPSKCSGCDEDFYPLEKVKRCGTNIDDANDRNDEENKSPNQELSSQNGLTNLNIKKSRKIDNWIFPILKADTNERVDPDEIKEKLKSNYIVVKRKKMPFVCLLDHDCTRSYLNATGIENHLFSWFYVVPCPNCRRKFKNYSNMIRHLERCKIQSKCKEVPVMPCKRPLSDEMDPLKEELNLPRSISSNQSSRSLDEQDEDLHLKLIPKVNVCRLPDFMINSEEPASKLDQMYSSFNEKLFSKDITYDYRYLPVNKLRDEDPSPSYQEDSDFEPKLVIDEVISDDCQSENGQNEIFGGKVSVSSYQPEGKTIIGSTIKKDNCNQFDLINGHGSFSQITDKRCRRKQKFISTGQDEVKTHQQEEGVIIIRKRDKLLKKSKPPEIKRRKRWMIRGDTPDDEVENLIKMSKFSFPTILKRKFNKVPFVGEAKVHQGAIARNSDRGTKAYRCPFCEYKCGPGDRYLVMRHLNGRVRKGSLYRPPCSLRRELKPADPLTGLYERLEPILIEI